MKKLFLLLIIFISIPLFADESVETADLSNTSKIDYEFSLQPKDDMTYRTFGMFRYLYSDELSSKFFASYETYKLEEEMKGFPGSSREEKSSDAMLDFYFIEYASKLLNDTLKLRAGLAFNIFIQNTEETADFTYGGVSQHSDNVNDVCFYSPKIELEAVYKYDRFGLKYQAEYIPVYYYTFNQEISITPLVSSGTVTNKYNDMGYPYLKNDIIVKLWFIELQGIHEYQALKFKLLTLANDTAGYRFLPQISKFHISNFTLFLNFRINVFENSDLVLGAGKKYEKTVNDDTNDVLRDRSQWMFNVSFMDRVF